MMVHSHNSQACRCPQAQYSQRDIAEPRRRRPRLHSTQPTIQIAETQIKLAREIFDSHAYCCLSSLGFGKGKQNSRNKRPFQSFTPGWKEEPPMEPSQWVDDAATDTCTLCNDEFTLVTRRVRACCMHSNVLIRVSCFCVAAFCFASAFAPPLVCTS